jgi:3-oxoacyl-[acyl-carrier-protein] synthase II
MKRRVVISGLGVVSPVGNDLDTFWSSLKAGKGGIGPITRFDAADFTSQIGGELKDFDATAFIDRKEIRRNDRYVHYAWVAALEAYKNAGLEFGDVDPCRLAVVIGSGIGGIETLAKQHSILVERGPSRVSPFFVPMMISDMANGQLSIVFNAKGPNYCTVSACASGAHAIGESYRMIADDMVDVMITGGAEAPVTPLALAGFCSMKALSTRNDDPEHASRPFDKERDGFVMGEGAGILILEEYERAKKRGARIYAEVSGYGSTADAYHVTAPDPSGDGAARAMQLALDTAQLTAADVDYINAHGTSTPLNDKCETESIKTVFGPLAKKVAISSTKSMTGHLLGAAGGVEMVACAKAIQEGIIPPTINYEVPDPELDLDYVPNEAREQKVRAAISNSLGFGGHNVSLLIRPV